MSQKRATLWGLALVACAGAAGALLFLWPAPTPQSADVALVEWATPAAAPAAPE